MKIVRIRGVSLPERAFPFRGNIYLPFDNGTELLVRTTTCVLRGEEAFPPSVVDVEEQTKGDRKMFTFPWATNEASPTMQSHKEAPLRIGVLHDIQNT